METKSEHFGKYLPLTFLIGFGFFTMGMMDPLYDSYVLVFLGKYINSTTIKGVIMSLDNMLALFLIPIVSIWSDRTRTRIGRRMPWILLLLPLSAICFGFIPYAAERSLITLIVLLVFLNLFKQSARGPVVALMPDTIPGEFRSQANGVINTMGNIAAIVGTLILARLMDVDKVLPILGATKNRLAFPVAALFVLVAVAFLAIFIREKTPEEEKKDGEARTPFFESIKLVFTAKDKSGSLILISLFLWFVGYQGVVPYLTDYSMRAFDLSAGQGPLAMGMVAVASVLSAIPMGYAASKWGRRRIIRISLLAISILTVFGFFLEPLGALFSIPNTQLIFVFWGLMFGYGVFWIAIVANSFPMLWQMAHHHNIGVYTGLYYTFSQLAAIVAPTLSGFVIDIAKSESKYRPMFLFCSVFFLLAFFTMGLVTGGEKTDAPVEA